MLKNLLFGKRLIIIIGILLTVVAAPLGILTMRQYMDAEATTETVDYETLKELIEPNRDKDPVKLSDNDKLAIPTDPDDGITYQLESLHIDATTGEVTTISNGVAQLSLPVMDAHDNKAVLGENDMAIYRGTNYDIALDATDDGFASYIVVLNENAPTDYEFGVELPSGYKLSEDGSNGIEILDEENEIVGEITAPWAVDSNGDSVPTVFKLRGDALVQTLQHSGSSYPVVADPSVTLGSGVYIRWGMPQDPDGLLRLVDGINEGIVDMNCDITALAIPVTIAMIVPFLRGHLSDPQIALVAAALALAGRNYCESAEDAADEAGDALDDVGEEVPDAIDPWTGEFPEDCTLMVRHRYLGGYANKIQVEQCASANGVYYD